MTDTETTIPLDRKRRAIRSGSKWVVQTLLPDGTWDMTAHWTGGRRSLYHFMEEHGIAPTREAEAQLQLVPENSGFKDR